ncbi:tkr-2 [Pristionchus pacificus]|uniref:Tkr-2 n=1 Tax=Pristionchus pacificus TaxID=54126 RepID=A0A2A6BHX2_PRIPA|nr:tkr-2 [Pristionchus pacificus]|eukprot:PDM65494.1 tkr-2 [Pristionchus pacificus]
MEELLNGTCGELPFGNATNTVLPQLELALSQNGCLCEAVKNLSSFEWLECEMRPRFHEIIIYIYAILFNIVIFSSVIGNSIVIWIVLCHERMRTVTNYYLLNLAIADASISILNTGFTWSYLVHYTWTWPTFYCSINNFMGIAPICASVFTMIVMSIDRYWAVVHPLRKRPGRKATVAVILIIWLVSCIVSLPAWLATHLQTYYHFDETDGRIHTQVICLADNFPDGFAHESLLNDIYSHMLTVIQYIVPLTVLSFTYWKVGGVLRKKESVGEVRHYKNIAAKKKASKMLALVVAIFMFVWLPYHCFFLLSGFLTTIDFLTGQFLFLNVYLFGMSSSIFNPIIYYFMNKRFRTGFKYVFRWLPFVNLEPFEYDSQLGGRGCPRGRGASFAPSYNSASHTHTLTQSLMPPSHF